MSWLFLPGVLMAVWAIHEQHYGPHMLSRNATFWLATGAVCMALSLAHEVKP